MPAVEQLMHRLVASRLLPGYLPTAHTITATAAQPVADASTTAFAPTTAAVAPAATQPVSAAAAASHAPATAIAAPGSSLASHRFDRGRGRVWQCAAVHRLDWRHRPAGRMLPGGSIVAGGRPRLYRLECPTADGGGW